MKNVKKDGGPPVPRDSTSQNMSSEDLEKTLVPLSEARRPEDAPPKPQAKPGPRYKIALSYLLRGKQKTASRTIFSSPMVAA